MIFLLKPYLPALICASLIGIIIIIILKFNNMDNIWYSVLCFLTFVSAFMIGYSLPKHIERFIFKIKRYFFH